MWVELYGEGLDAFYPVADTEIGKIGTLVCMDGSYPETARGGVLKGAGEDSYIKAKHRRVAEKRLGLIGENRFAPKG